MSRESKHRSYVQLVQNRAGNAALVRTRDAKQRLCWFVIHAVPLQLLRLQRTDGDALVDLTQYGEVVACGWGHEPDAQAWPSN